MTGGQDRKCPDGQSIPRDPGGVERLLTAIGWLRAVQLALGSVWFGGFGGE
ncbi:hypothetical protein L195_g041236, partial [Trifolium pratense]